jgi:hypothetical protein
MIGEGQEGGGAIHTENTLCFYKNNLFLPEWVVHHGYNLVVRVVC